MSNSLETPGDAAEPVEILHQIKSERSSLVDAIKKDVEKIGTQPTEVIFLDVLKSELPYIVMLSMAVVGIGLVTFTGGLPGLYWQLLTVVYCALCISVGWRRAQTQPERVKLVWTQVLHWASFLGAMWLIYTPTMRALVDVNATGLDLMVLLALGTVVAGIHAEAWQICIVGLILALFAPAVAIVEHSSLFILIAALGVTFIAVSLWMAFHAQRHATKEAA